VHISAIPSLTQHRETETRIFDRQHDALKFLMKGNHVKKIRNPRTILDLGTGKGAWAAEIAKEFATADEVVGVDIERIAPLQYPPNCRFEVLFPESALIFRLRICLKGFGTLRTTSPSFTRER
jgi:hypothetical protein